VKFPAIIQGLCKKSSSLATREDLCKIMTETREISPACKKKQQKWLKKGPTCKKDANLDFWIVLLPSLKAVDVSSNTPAGANGVSGVS
jgi:hypothetical protein